MLIIIGGVLICICVVEICGMGCVMQGVMLILLDDGEKLVGFEKVVELVVEVDVEGESELVVEVGFEVVGDVVVEVLVLSVDDVGNSEGGEV